MTSTTETRTLARYLPAKYGASTVELQRRKLMRLAVAGLGLAFGGPLLARAAAAPSLLETTSGGADTLDAAEEQIYAVGLGHMRPDTDPDDMSADAARIVAAVYALRQGAPEPIRARALYVEALAAAALGSIYGHARHWQLADPLFRSARSSARRAGELGEVRAPGALMVAAALEAKVVLYMHPDKTVGALGLAQVAAQATHPSTGQAAPPGSALAVSLVARAHAARGNHSAAAVTLDEAARLIEDPGYFAAPFLSEVVPVDGPMSLFGYGEHAHNFTRAEVAAAAGDYDTTMSAVTAYLAADAPVSNTSAATSRLLEPRALMNAGHVGEGAELAHDILVHLEPGHRNPHVIGRGLDLVDLGHRLTPAGHAAPGPLDHLAAYMRRAAAPLASTPLAAQV